MHLFFMGVLYVFDIYYMLLVVCGGIRCSAVGACKGRCDLGMYVFRYVTLYGFYIFSTVCELFM